MYHLTEVIDLGLEHREVPWPNPVHTLMKMCCLLEEGSQHEEEQGSQVLAYVGI